MSKGIGPKEQALRAMREAKLARRPREPETHRSTVVEPEAACLSKARSGKTGVCMKKQGHQGRHQYKEQ